MISFLYKLHYSLHVPELWGLDQLGIWLMGSIALLWTLDGFVGFYLTLPARKPVRSEQPAAVRRELAKGWWPRWKPAWKIKSTGSAYRVSPDETPPGVDDGGRAAALAAERFGGRPKRFQSESDFGSRHRDRSPSAA